MKNKLTAGSNLLWESSRMMLPEHKALLREHEASRDKKQRPSYDEQFLTDLVYQIETAFIENRMIKLTYYEDEAYHERTGKIIAINRERQQFQLSSKTETDRFSLIDLISIE
ncbi:MAG TPA: YolD-like family protein [Bacilli bacterium]|nr:YolD-like family protein [Bacilli bacterium]